MFVSRIAALIVGLLLLLIVPQGCFFYGGASTLKMQTQASGSGFLTATERNGQWDAPGPPPRVGEITDRQLYRKMQQEAVYSVIGASRDYELSDPYPLRRYRIVAIRDAGTSTENGATVHYYAVEFDPAGSN